MRTLKNLIITLLLSLMFVQLHAAAFTTPYNLRCFDKVNPIGTSDHPYFGWYINNSNNNELQTAYQIIISSSLANLDNEDGDIWNSGKVNSTKQNYVYLEGKQLAAATLYYWKVRIWDKAGVVGVYSAAATFETGLLTNADWEGAKWVKRDTKDNDDYTYFRKRFQLSPKKVKHAVTYIAACHSYELYINGKFVAKGFDNHYPQYSYFHAWDITSLLNSNSENSIACLTHWYGGGQGRATGTRGLLIKTIIEYTDGTKTLVCSDKSWKLARAEQWVLGQPQRNGEGNGRVELYDSRKVINGWYNIKFEDATWANATEIGSHPVVPWTGTLRSDLTRVIEKEIKPVSVKDLGHGKYVIDLGKIYSGSFKIPFQGGNTGDTIRMLGGFVLNKDNTVSKKWDQETNLNFYFILNGKTAVFNPYVYLGLRYLQIENSPSPITKDNVSFIFRHFELDPSRSSFTSSNQMLNKVWDLMIHSLMVGAQEGFVDTPTREKGSFLGDGWSQAVPAMSTMYDRAMNLRVLKEFLDSQDQYWPDGRLNAVYPNVDGGRDISDYTQSYLVWIWDYYMQTGNAEFLKDNYSRLKKVADYVATYRNDSTGLIHKLKGGKGPYEFGIIDWPKNMRYGYDMTVESRTVIDAYAYTDFDIMSRIAEVTGNTADKTSYRTKADNMKQAMNSLLINKQGVYIDGINADKTESKHVSQHANAMPLALNIVPEANRKQVIAEVKNRKMNVGMVFLRWLPEALGQANEGEHMIDLYTNTSWDGWAKTIALGGTVTWESWNANETNESMSHPWGAVGLLAMQNYILGIKPLTPQHELIQIKPLWFADKLTFAKGLYPTDKGDIRVDWNYSNGIYTLNINIPVNVTARVYVPKCAKAGNIVTFDSTETQAVEEDGYLFLDNIGSGEHTFVR